MASRSLSYYYWPLGMAGILAATAIANGILLSQALRSSTDLIQDNPYEYGLDYGKVVEELKRGREYGVTPHVTVAAGADGLREITLLLERNGSSLGGFDVELEAKSPLSKEDDFRMALAESAEKPGTYQAASPLKRAGLWLFSIRAHELGKSSDEAMRFELRTVVN